MKTRKSNILGEQVMLEGLMTFGKLETEQRTLDFECCEDVVVQLPQKLTEQANNIASKMIRKILLEGGELG